MNERHQLEEKLQYKFNNKKLLMTAVTHSSYVKEHCHEEKSNERLEFLGDAFFDAIIGEELFHIFPHEEEGFLSRIRATLVCEKSLAQEAKKLELGQYLLLGNGEEKSGGRTRESILADCMEAIIGAVYLDGGFEAVKDCGAAPVRHLPLKMPDMGNISLQITRLHCRKSCRAVVSRISNTAWSRRSGRIMTRHLSCSLL